MNYSQSLKIPATTIIYSSLEKNLKIKIKPIIIKKIKPKLKINFKNNIFFIKNENNIKKINSYNIILESSKINYYTIGKIFIEIKAKIVIYHLNKYFKNEIFVKEIVTHKIVNTTQKNIKFKSILKTNSLDIINNFHAIVHFSLYLL